MASLPTVIQGGMGIAVSGWRLANAVSRAGGLGVVSGAAIAVVLARRLQRGDEDGSCRRALARFPSQALAARVLEEHFVEGGKRDDAPYRLTAMPTLRSPDALVRLTVAAAFVEVWLAKEGHDGPVGINLLEKVQIPTLPTLYGAMLAGVDVVLVGAGIPRAIPGALDRLARGERAEIPAHVEGASPADRFTLSFDPAAATGAAPPLRRPRFLAIVASDVLASALLRKADGRIDGFVVEGPSAGGHNAPPRGGSRSAPERDPVYGARDVPDLAAFRAMGLPFWLAGSYGRPGRLREALAQGASGVQVGTAFAFCDESGVVEEVRREVVARSRAGAARVRTDALASPTGFPFKVAEVSGSLSEASVHRARDRVCDLGYLRRPYRREDGSVGYRCPAEPVAEYVRKGGAVEDTHGRLCVCNGLSATVGLGQVRADGSVEPALVTAGDDVVDVHRHCAPGRDGYAAADVLRTLLEDSNARCERRRRPGP